MKEAVLTAVASAAAVALMWWYVGQLKVMLHRRKIYNWLRANMLDEPGKSHVSTEMLEPVN